MTTSFFNGAFFNGEFFNTGTTPVVVTPTVTPAGRSTRGGKRRVLIGDRLFEVENLRDVESLLRRVVRQEAEPVVEAAKARVRVVDRVSAKLDAQAPVALPMASVEVDWGALWSQLALQSMEYAHALERVLMRQEEDDLESILLTLH